MGEFSDADQLLLAQLIEAESEGESFEGKVAVGAVVMNRLSPPQSRKLFTSQVNFSACKMVLWPRSKSRKKRASWLPKKPWRERTPQMDPFFSSTHLK